VITPHVATFRSWIQQRIPYLFNSNGAVSQLQVFPTFVLIARTISKSSITLAVSNLRCASSLKMEPQLIRFGFDRKTDFFSMFLISPGRGDDILRPASSRPLGFAVVFGVGVALAR
jgi:hypothetical protein